MPFTTSIRFVTPVIGPRLDLVQIEIQISSKPSGMTIPAWQCGMIYELLIKSKIKYTSISIFTCIDSR